MNIACKIALFMAAVCCLTGCIDMETSITVEQNGSGSVRMVYSVSKMVMELGKLDEESSFSPLPVSEEDFLATAAMVPGIEIQSVSTVEDEKKVSIDAEYDFTSVNDLSAFFSPDRENDPSLETEGEEQVFRYTLFRAADGEISPESMKMIESFFAEDEIIIRLEAPSAIQSVNYGEILGNGRTAEYSVGIYDIFSRNQDIIWEVRW